MLNQKITRNQSSLFDDPVMPTVQLRPYQEEAIKKLLWAKDLPGNDICVLPTGAGKSIVIAHLAKALNEPILILQPSREILEQNYKKLCLYVNPASIGIYSASMQEKTINFYTFATIQSIYQRSKDFAHFNTVIIDECHNLNPKNLQGMFTSFLKQIDAKKVIGFTATPYRMGVGYSWEINPFGEKVLMGHAAIKMVNRVKERFWKRIIYNINNHELTKQGYLAPLEYIDRQLIPQDDIPMNKSLTDFNLEQYEERVAPQYQKIMDAIRFAQKDCKSVLVFCSSVGMAELLASKIPQSAVVSAKTRSTERAQIIQDFKDGKIKVVCNMGVLTTGFDHPSLDCIILARPTRSLALYYQMLGRGVRMAEGKTSCKVIDFTGTVKFLGRIETIRIEKEKGLWDIYSETGKWHDAELYSYQVKTARPKTLKDFYTKARV